MTSAPQVISSLTITVAAGATEARAVAGQYLWIQTTTQPISVIVNDGSPFTCPAGPVLNLGTFTTLTFTNNTAAAITLTFWYGSAAMIAFANGAQKDAATIAQSTFAAALANGATQIIPGNANGLQRRQIVITNWDNNNDLLITDLAGNGFDAITARTTHTYDTAAGLKLSAAFGALTKVYVGEIYYSA